MCARRHSWLVLISLLALLAPISSAHGQAWLSDRKRAEGRGLRFGDFEFHPGVGAEVGYYTNPFYSDAASRFGGGTASLRVSPHLYLSTLKGERVEGDERDVKLGWIAFSGGVAAAFQKYFNDNVRDVFNLDLNADATIAPERPLSLRVTEQLRRTSTPFSDPARQPSVGAQAAPQTAAVDFTNYYESASVLLQGQSQGGLLKGGLGYRLGYAWFDSASFNYNDNLAHNVSLNMGWEFLPKTALFYDVGYSYQQYLNLTGSGASTVPRRTMLANSEMLTARVGANGAITSTIGATVAIGYAAGFFRAPADGATPRGDDPYGVVGNVEARYTPTPFAELALAFDRGFSPSYQGNFQEFNRIAARTRWMFFGALLVGARVGVEFLKFGFDTVQQQARDDRRYFVDINGEYRFVDWLALTAQFNLLVDDTDFVYRASTGLQQDPARFTAAEMWLGVRAFL